MFGERLKVLVCLSVFMSTCVSMHMVRDAYHRPINDQLPNPYDIIDRNGVGHHSVVNNWLDQVDDHKKRPSNGNDVNDSQTSYKALNLDFERLIEPIKNDHHNYNERPAAIGDDGGGTMPMIFPKNQKRKYQITTNRLIESKLIGNSGDVMHENQHGSRYESLSHSSKPLVPKKSAVAFRSGLLPRSSTATATNDRFQWQQQVSIAQTHTTK